MLKRAALAALTIVVLSAIATATAGLLETHDLVQRLNAPSGGGDIKAHVDPVPAGAPQTILILGSDKRFGTANSDRRSDTILLMRLNADADAIALMSIPRDLEVDVPGSGQVKINEAYTLGGDKLTANVVRQVFTDATGIRFRINHIVDINFSLFQRLVNRLGCVYTDIDRYYYHASTGRIGDYSAIDIKPGYQRLCGSDALAFVRYRHTDTDIVRAARQQNFLSDAKSQYGTSLIINHRKQLASLFGRYTRFDHSLKTETGFIKLLDLAINLAGKPTVQVPFPAILPLPGDPKQFVTDDSYELSKQVERFLDVKAGGTPTTVPSTSPTDTTPKAKPKAKRAHGKRKHAKAKKQPASSVPAGMLAAASAGEAQGVALGAGVGFPVYYPALIPSTASYLGPLAGGTVYPRAYYINGRNGRPKWPAYRFVLDSHRGLGNYIGVQGTTWPDPPILKRPGKILRAGHKRLLIFYDGSNTRMVAWKAHHAVYWIVNTLQESLNGKQMIAMAASFSRIGSH